MVTIGLVANVYNEANALPGWLETHLPHFDDVRVLHAGPNGEYSNDGTLEILQKWHVPVEFCAIDDGFGVVRSRALRMSPCDYVMLLDADERFYANHRVMLCEGQGTPQDKVDWILQSYDYRGVNLPNWENVSLLGAGLRVSKREAYDQFDHLRGLIARFHPDAIACARRHWHDMSMWRPTQNWNIYSDWQLRMVQNDPSIHFDPCQRMHERLCGQKNVIHGDHTHGPFFDHFHFTFKRMEQDQRAHDVAIYDAIHEGKEPPTWKKFRS